MRKITQQAVSAFYHGRNFKSGNTEVRVDAEGNVTMFLHGNAIATSDAHGAVFVNHCGWPTPTTFDRLRGLGANVYTRKGVPMLDGKPMAQGWHALGEPS